MKTAIKLLLTLIPTLCFLMAEGDHHHGPLAGPQGGKILEFKPHHVEFLIQPDKKVSITFYDSSMKPISPQSQEIKVIAEPKSGKVILQLEKTKNGFISKSALPDGDGYRIVIQMKANTSSKPQNFRIDYQSHLCGGCKLQEYACTCDH